VNRGLSPDAPFLVFKLDSTAGESGDCSLPFAFRHSEKKNNPNQTMSSSLTEQAAPHTSLREQEAAEELSAWVGRVASLTVNQYIFI
jgi:hypothetical protein